jgi:hypothetical protein
MTHELFRHLNTSASITLECKINVIASLIDSRNRSIPFLRYLLERSEKEEETSTLVFPSIQGPESDLRSKCVELFPEFQQISYVGYVIFNKEVYAFVSILDIQTSSKIQLSNKRWWCLVDEILNYRGVLNCFVVDKKCVGFLFSNVDYYTLRNERGIQLENPYVAFLTSDNIKHTELEHYFGPIKQEYNHYVFESCVELSGAKGVIRYAVFGTTPMTVDGKTRWFVRNMNDVVSLSWHLIESG